jgi:hypothetical protein
MSSKLKYQIEREELMMMSLSDVMVILLRLNIIKTKVPIMRAVAYCRRLTRDA